MSDQQYNGLLIVDKPGRPSSHAPTSDIDLPTSHDIVQRLRRISNQRRIGHTGTLDPMASGVLVLCFGAATRLVEYYQGHNKSYIATITLGAETDTYDALGKTVLEKSVPKLDKEDILRALEPFQGEIQQHPPVYSALKQRGESLYRKARRGEEIQTQARPVTIHRIELLDFRLPEFTIEVHCAAGTYIRSLARDLGQELGTAGYLSYLRRVMAGSFSQDEAHSMPSIEAAARHQRFVEILLPVGTKLDLPAISVDDDTSIRLGYGQKRWIPTSALSDVQKPNNVRDWPGNRQVDPGDVIQALDGEGRFLGILEILELSDDGRNLLCKADKWLATAM